MAKSYSNELKHKVSYKICVDKESTSKIAEEYGIPLKTVEKWVTSFNKDPECFKVSDGYIFAQRSFYASRYDSMDREKLIKEIKRRDTQIQYLQSVISAKDRL